MMLDKIKAVVEIVSRQISTYAPQIDVSVMDDNAIAAATESFNSSYILLAQLQYNVDYSLGLQPVTMSDVYSRYIANNETVERVILNSVIELRLKMDLDEAAWSTMCWVIAQMLYLGPLKNPKYPLMIDAHMCTPSEVSGKYTAPEANYSMLILNPWLVVCILMSYGDPVTAAVSVRGGKTRKKDQQA